MVKIKRIDWSPVLESFWYQKLALRSVCANFWYKFFERVSPVLQDTWATETDNLQRQQRHPADIYQHQLVATTTSSRWLNRLCQFNSIQFKSSLLTKGSQMAKRIQYIKTNQMIKVNEILKNNKTNDKNSSITQYTLYYLTTTQDTAWWV